MKESRHKILQKSFYADAAGTFDRDQRRENRNHLNKIKAVSDFLRISEGDRVLEIGSGTGIHARRLLEMNGREFSFVCSDISAAMLEEARRKTAAFQRVHFAVADGERLPFADGTFDKIFISGSLHHFFSPERGIGEILRTLKRGGRFCIMEPNGLFPTNLWAICTKPEERRMWWMRRANFVRSLSGREVAFEIGNFAYTPPFPRWLVPVFDVADRVLGRVPLLNRISVMLFVRGTKI